MSFDIETRHFADWRRTDIYFAATKKSWKAILYLYLLKTIDTISHLKRAHMYFGLPSSQES